MKMTMKTMAVLAALVGATGAQAALTGGLQTPDSSAVFVVRDNTGGSAISLTVDLGYSFSDFIAGGSLATAGTRVEWNFSTNAVRMSTNAGSTWSNVAGTFGYSTEYSTFTGAAQVADIRWGVVAYDSLDTPDGTGRGLLVTGTPSATQMNAVTALRLNNALGAMDQFYAASQIRGTHASFDNGANTATSGTAYVPTGLNTAIGNGTNIWAYLLANNGVSRLQYLTTAANPPVTQLGLTNVVDGTIASIDNATTFQFDMTTNTLTYAVPVPEPGTYALMAAGLLAVGALARRRRA